MKYNEDANYYANTFMASRIPTDKNVFGYSKVVTIEAKFPRMILSQWNTHRVFCLEENTEIYFDLPSKSKKGHKRNYKVKIKDLYNKFHYGTNERKNKITALSNKDLCKIQKEKIYTVEQISEILEMSRETIIGLIKSNIIKNATKQKLNNKEIYLIPGISLHDAKSYSATNRQPLRKRISNMNIRTYDEKNHLFINSKIKDIFDSGIKDVYEFQFSDGKTIRSTLEHKYLQSSGKWDSIKNIFSIKHKENFITWKQNSILANGKEMQNKNPSGRVKTSKEISLEKVTYIGKAQCYDIEIEGPYKNFVANGIIVHNSRNVSSDRAVPTKKLRKSFANFVPREMPKNGRGMHPTTYLKGIRKLIAKGLWLTALHLMKLISFLMEKVGVHKEIANRLLDPFLWTVSITTSSFFKNFLELRTDANAQVQIRKIAILVQKQLSNAEYRIRHIHLPLIDRYDVYDVYLYSEKQVNEKHIEYISRLVQNGSNDITKYEKIPPRIWDLLIKVNTAKTARGSYLNQLEPKPIKSQLDVYSKLVESEPIHASPLESCAMSYDMYKFLRKPLKWNNRTIEELNGNFALGIVQYRKCVEKTIE